MLIKSKALEVNLASYHVDAPIDPKYALIQDIMSKFYGLTDSLNIFLKELSHPYRNWQFIVQEARNFSLDYFYLLKKHPEGPQATLLFVDIFLKAIQESSKLEVKTEAVDNLMLFLQKIIRESEADFSRFATILDHAFNAINAHSDYDFFLFVRSYYQLSALGEEMHRLLSRTPYPISNLNPLLIRYYRSTYDYWLHEEDPAEWFRQEAVHTRMSVDLDAVFQPISMATILRHQEQLTHLADRDMDATATLEQLVTFPGYGQFVKTYAQTPRKLFDKGEEFGQGRRWKLFFLFRIMNIEGLSLIHEEALRDINRTLTWLIAHEEQTRSRKLIKSTFAILKRKADDFPATALNCVLNMGEGVYKTDDNDFVNFFVDFVIELGFQSPMIAGVGNDWQIRANHDHIQNIRNWLRLIQIKPQWSTRMLSALIIHLSISGVFIKDTDLFPRDITYLLNSDIEPVYNLVKQLCRLFPSFFNDIGAEGELRDISTQLDELCHRKDRLVHFLRKQSHVESSNRITGLMEAALHFWKTRDKSPLEPFLPPYLYSQLETEGPYIDGVHSVMVHLEKQGLSRPTDFLTPSSEAFKLLLEHIPEVSAKDLERVSLLRDFYKLLYQKYNLNFLEIDTYISHLNTEALPDLQGLKKALQETDLKKKIRRLLNYLKRLKEIIFSEEQFEIREDIYKKRHITIDIPSMYGSYHELKFDAMGLTFRIESLLNVMFEDLVESIDLTLITKATFFQIFNRLKLFDKALKLDGLSSGEFTRQMEFLAHALQTRGFSYTQYLDIFKGFAQAVKNIIHDHFNNIHEQNLNRVLSHLPLERILPKYLPDDTQVDREKLKHRVSEIFFRDKISQSLGLTQLDLLLSRILNILFHQAGQLSGENLLLLLNYDPHRAMAALDNPTARNYGIIHLGNKGLNLLRLKTYGWPIPPGFIITTEVFRCFKVIDRYQPAKDNFRQQTFDQLKALEKTSGKILGDSKKPLLLSVRSGSSISQPGMMDTLLNVGINEAIAQGMAEHTGNAWFAWDNYRRFLQCYGMAFGQKRDDFDAIIGDFKQKLGIRFKSGFTGDQMRTIALAYKQMILDAGIDIEEDPFEQMLICIQKILDSWESAKAKTYRKIMGISDDWGTAVTAQTMVFGNLSEHSGTGVLFTHSPRLSSDSLRLWGDFTIGNQGEDVVSGLVRTLPISKIQQDMEQRETDITLETHFPEIYQSLKKYVFQLIYDKGWSPQEMEFTFESPSRKDLYLLQTRDMAMRERKKVFIFDLEDVLSRKDFLGHGIGVSGGALSGRIVFDLDEINIWRKKEPDRFLILVRGDTVPDDIREIFASDGLLTARGGLTSHAAVVAHRLEKTCVVGCGNMVCDEKNKIARFGSLDLHPGDFISIDGQEGSVYKGLLKVKQE